MKSLRRISAAAYLSASLTGNSVAQLQHAKRTAHLSPRQRRALQQAVKWSRDVLQSRAGSSRPTVNRQTNGDGAPQRSGKIRSSTTPGSLWRVSSSVAEGPLTNDQAAIVSSALKGESLFITGPSGVGKSACVRAIVQGLDPARTLCLGPTRDGAVNVDGITVGHACHLRAGDLDRLLREHDGNKVGALTKLLASATWLDPIAAGRWRRCSTLVLDEISMWHPRVFRTLDAVARGCTNTPADAALPFGGRQIVIAGDFLKLPPVMIGPADSGTCLETSSWNQLKLQPAVLMEDLRLRGICRHNAAQCASQALTTILCSNLRFGDVAAPEVSRLLAQLSTPAAAAAAVENGVDDEASDSFGETLADLPPPHVVSLFSSRRQADAHNATIFEALDEVPRTFHRTISEDGTPRQSLPGERPLELKIGTRVMLTTNLDFSRGLVCGAVGHVVEFASPRSPNGFELHRRLRYVEQKIGGGDGKNGRGAAALAGVSDHSLLPVVEFLVPAFPQRFATIVVGRTPDVDDPSSLLLPLRVSWAATIQEVHPFTIAGVNVDFGQLGWPESSVLYTAIGRAGSVDGLTIDGTLSSRGVRPPLTRLMDFQRSIEKSWLASTAVQETVTGTTVSLNGLGPRRPRRVTAPRGGRTH